MLAVRQRAVCGTISPGNGIFSRTYVVTLRHYDIVTPPTHIHLSDPIYPHFPQVQETNL